MSVAEKAALRRLRLRKLLGARRVSRESAAASSLSSALLQAASVSCGGTLLDWVDLWPPPAWTAPRLSFQWHKIRMLMYVNYKISFKTVMVSHI